MKAKLVKESELLGDISKAFAESLDLEETLASILRSLDTHLKLRRGTIALLDPETEMINTRVAHGLSKKSKTLASYKIGEGITGLVVQSGKEIVVPDISKDPRFLHKTRARKQEKTPAISSSCLSRRRYGDTLTSSRSSSFGPTKRLSAAALLMADSRNSRTSPPQPSRPMTIQAGWPKCSEFTAAS